MRNYESGSQSNLDWLAQEEAYEDVLSPPTMSMRKETEASAKVLREQVRKLTLYLKREKATVAALQDRLIYEEELNAKLRKRLDVYEKGDSCPPLETKSSLISNRKVVPNVRSGQRRSQQKRPPWNDDFSGVPKVTVDKDKALSSSPPPRRRPRPKEQWNNDFTEVRNKKRKTYNICSLNHSSLKGILGQRIRGGEFSVHHER